MTRYPNKLLTIAVIVTLGSLFLIAGCSDNDSVTTAPPQQESSLEEVTELDLALWGTVLEMSDLWVGIDTTEYNLGSSHMPFPSTPDQLMENFAAIYETMDVLEYLKIMHEDFETVLQQITIDEFPDVGPTLSRYEEQNVHKRMFSGEAVTDPEGALVPGVQGIHFDVLQPVGTWEMASAEDYFPDAMWAPYEVSIMWNRGENFSTMKVEGIIRFYVTALEFEHEGNDYQFYQMVGQVDLTGATKSVEEATWGSVKALFR